MRFDCPQEKIPQSSPLIHIIEEGIYGSACLILMLTFLTLRLSLSIRPCTLIVSSSSTLQRFEFFRLLF